MVGLPPKARNPPALVPPKVELTYVSPLSVAVCVAFVFGGLGLLKAPFVCPEKVTSSAFAEPWLKAMMTATANARLIVFKTEKIDDPMFCSPVFKPTRSGFGYLSCFALKQPAAPGHLHNALRTLGPRLDDTIFGGEFQLDR